MADSKDTIYVDIDDEITALIDKVRASNAKVVALVLPKRAAVLQSIVNMKLLKRTADNEKKNLILITSEAGLMPLAGAVGLHVAKTLSTKPEIPPPPNVGSEAETVDEDLNFPLGGDEELPDLTENSGKAAAVGALAEAAKQSSSAAKTDPNLETLELDNEDEVQKKPKEGAGAAAAAHTPKSKKLKIPNFDRFRLILLLGITGLVVLIILLVLALDVWPHATIDIKTNASNVNTNLTLTLDTQAQSADPVSGDIPAKMVSEQKTYSQTVNTTGQKNEGTAATGSVTMTAADCNGTFGGAPSFTIPAGTGVSYNSLTYITQGDTQMNYSGFKHNCFDYTSSGSTNITAQGVGSSYNASNISNATVAGYPEASANGSASGGTDNIVQVVAQADISSATSKISAGNSSSAESDLSNELKGQGLYPVDATFSAGSPQITSSPNVGDQSNTVTVTETVNYTMYGAKLSDIQAVVDSNIRSQTSSDQNIITDGVNQGAFKQQSSNATTDQVGITTLAEVGPNISVSQIKRESAGKSPSQIIDVIKQNPDVTNVTVKLSPFWVSSAPGASKITVNIAKPSAAP